MCVTGGDPIKAGLVSSLAHPEGNITGVNLLASPLYAKRIQIIRQLVPQASVVGFVYNPKNANAVVHVRQIEAAARANSIEIRRIPVSSTADIEKAVAGLSRDRPHALVVATDSLLNRSVDQLVALATRTALPTLYGYRRFTVAGGLASYGTSLTKAAESAGVYVAKVLKGARPKDLPIQQSETVELVINLNTAKKLGLRIPQELQLRADEVIE